MEKVQTREYNTFLKVHIFEFALCCNYRRDIPRKNYHEGNVTKKSITTTFALNTFTNFEKHLPYKQEFFTKCYEYFTLTDVCSISAIIRA